MGRQAMYRYVSARIAGMADSQGKANLGHAAADLSQDYPDPSIHLEKA
jgi:hypothetical protein